jgi:purine-cytosine permease-like protein
MAFWTRTRRFLAILWVSTIILEAALFELFRRTNDSWVLLLALLIVAIPIVAGAMTSDWFTRPRRKRWKQHDLDEAIRAGRDPAEARAELLSQPSSS